MSSPSASALSRLNSESVSLSAIVLSLNEEKHLARCLGSLNAAGASALVVDCFSQDRTLEIASCYGAQVVQRNWVNYATQFNWGLSQLPPDTRWVIRLDSDEYLTPSLVEEIKLKLSSLPDDVVGINVSRRMTFQGRLIKHGGVFPIRVLRIFRYGAGECENRWMDEHIKVSGRVVDFGGEIIDDNLNNLTWWTDKHNKYANREVVDLMNLEYGFIPHDSVAGLSGGGQAGFKRWLKESVYSRLPMGFRAFVYFFYRYVMRLGFLDGQAGTAFHLLQGFWYRYLVDAKLLETKRYMRQQNVDAPTAIQQVLGIDVRAGSR